MAFSVLVVFLALRKRIKFIRALKKTCRENGFTLFELKRPYRSIFRDNGKYTFGVEANGYSLAAGGGRAYVYRDGTLSPMSDPTAPLGYGVEEDEATIWQMGSELADGDIVLVVSKAVTEALSDDELEDILYLSNYPAEHILCSAKDEGLEKDAPAAVVAAKVGGGDFREIDPDVDYEDDDGKYDAWA